MAQKEFFRFFRLIELFQRVLKGRKDTICVCVDVLTSQTYWRPCWKTDVIKMVTETIENKPPKPPKPPKLSNNS